MVPFSHVTKRGVWGVAEEQLTHRWRGYRPVFQEHLHLLQCGRVYPCQDVLKHAVLRVVLEIYICVSVSVRVLYFCLGVPACSRVCASDSVCLFLRMCVYVCVLSL